MTISERRIRRGPEGGIWKGSDIEAAGTVTIGPSQTALVAFILYPHNLPPLGERAYPSVRSRYAQVGIGIEAQVVHRIADAATIERNGHKSLTAEVPVTNHGVRAIKIGKGEKVFRLYSYSRDQI